MFEQIGYGVACLFALVLFVAGTSLFMSVWTRGSDNKITEIAISLSLLFLSIGLARLCYLNMPTVVCGG